MRFSIRKRLDANQRSEILLWWAPKLWITPKLKKALRLKSELMETDFLHNVSATLLKSILQQVGPKIVDKSR